MNQDSTVHTSLQSLCAEEHHVTATSLTTGKLLNCHFQKCTNNGSLSLPMKCSNETTQHYFCFTDMCAFGKCFNQNTSECIYPGCTSSVKFVKGSLVNYLHGRSTKNMSCQFCEVKCHGSYQTWTNHCWECPLVSLKCTYCDHMFQKQNMQDHHMVCTHARKCDTCEQFFSLEEYNKHQNVHANLLLMTQRDFHKKMKLMKPAAMEDLLQFTNRMLGIDFLSENVLE